MYCRPQSAHKQEPLVARSIGSFFYDYSEEFDTDQPQREITPAPPLAPIPKRAASFTKPYVLREETQAGFDAAYVAVGKDGTSIGDLPEKDPPLLISRVLESVYGDDDGHCTVTESKGKTLFTIEHEISLLNPNNGQNPISKSSSGCRLLLQPYLTCTT
jgi:hypothetical protein